MEKFVEILKIVGKFLTIFIAKIIYYLVKGCIAFGRYCAIGFGIAHKYIVKFIKEKQWRVITDKFGNHKTPTWNSDKNENPAVSDYTKEYNYSPEESMDRAYRIERTSTPVVDPGHHADKNKVVVKAIDETPSFNGSIIVKESSAHLKPAPVTPAPDIAVKTEVLPSPVADVSNEEPQNDVSYKPTEEHKPAETIVEVQEEISTESLEIAEPVVEENIDLQPSESEPESEPADLSMTNISFGGEDEGSEAAKEDAPVVETEAVQQELSSKITFEDIKFVELSEEEKTDEPSSEPASVVNAVVEEPKKADFVVAEKEDTEVQPELEVVNHVEETATEIADVESPIPEEKGTGNDFPFAPMDDALDFSDPPVDEPSVTEPEPTLNDLFSIEEAGFDEKPASPTPTASPEQTDEHAQENKPADAPKQEPKKGNIKAKVEKELDFEKDQYTEGSLFGF